MRAQHLRLGVLRPQPFHDIVPQRARGAHLGDLHEEVHADAPEEGQARRKGIDIEPRFHRALGVFLAVGDGKGQFLHRRRPGFVHVIARNRNAVEFRHVGRSICDDVRNDPHARFGRIDIGVADHELLEDVVLDGPGQLVLGDALPFGGNNVEGQHGDDRAVHRHRYAHRVERDLVEQDLHVAHGVDRDARLADIADDARVIAVIAAVRGEIECDRQTLLPGGKVAAIEGVRFLCRGEARILADGPRAPGVHRGVGPARERRDPRHPGIDQRGSVLGGIQRLYRDPFGRVPGEIAPLHFLVGEGLPVVISRLVGHARS